MVYAFAPVGLLSLASRAVRATGGVVRALTHRTQVRRLAELDDRALKDIGLTRDDVVGALEVPLLRDPSLILAGRHPARRNASRPLHAAEGSRRGTLRPSAGLVQ